ncbi:MAG: hypothetical protein JWN43_2109 [Gammaproteobacteria bacterium]|nr:hypothetical protein [Gammaproteobacteria bacterium]
MRLPWRWHSISIFWRTYLLMLAVLAVSASASLALLIDRLPATDAPVSLSQVAHQLRVPGDEPFRGPPPPHGPGSGPGPPPGGGFDGGGTGEHPGRSPVPGMVVTASLSRPAMSTDASMAPSESLRIQLAQALGIKPVEVLVYVAPEPPTSHLGVPGAEATLSGSFIAARQLPDQTWRIVERVVEGFPNAFERKISIFLALALVALAPFSWLFSRTLSAPIRRFAEAARRLGHDPNAPLLLREGPAEMLLAVDSFNTMQARIDRLIRERTHMVGAIAHDLRTPLTRLAFRLDDLPHPLSEKVDADIQEMKSMISAALDFLRDRSLGGHHERLDFRLLVERVANDQSDLGHDVTLEAGTPVTVEGTPLALRRMVANLVENALKYGERARLRLRTVDSRCVLEIEDDGPGIPEQMQHQVFEPFFRIEASRNRDTGGIGLGLATVRAIVLDHGGEITMGNRKNGGLRVTISLHLARA